MISHNLKANKGTHTYKIFMFTSVMKTNICSNSIINFII